MRRRLFLAGGLALLSLPAWANEVKMLEVDCPERAFEETRRNLAAMQKPERLDDNQFITQSRAWLGGPDIKRQGPHWRDANGVPLRIYGNGSKGVVLHIHGGGWICGNAESDHKLCQTLADRAGVTVASVDYRLAPEFPYPVPIQDCLTAAGWLIGNSHKEFGSERLAILGLSAGSHLAAMTLLGLGSQALRFQAAAFYYGVFDLGLTPAARMAKDQDHPDLSPSSLLRMVSWFTPGLRREQRQVAAISPLYAPIPELPDTLMLVGGSDVLLDDSLQLARRWAERNTVQLAVYPGAPHGFNGYEIAGVEDSLDRVVDFFGSRL
ncbi:alpha/beta hydrolase [bacterium]|nr:alpha/beta hydrolase [bacterium]